MPPLLLHGRTNIVEQTLVDLDYRWTIERVDRLVTVEDETNGVGSKFGAAGWKFVVKLFPFTSNDAKNSSTNDRAKKKHVGIYLFLRAFPSHAVQQNVNNLELSISFSVPGDAQLKTETFTILMSQAPKLINQTGGQGFRAIWTRDTLLTRHPREVEISVKVRITELGLRREMPGLHHPSGVVSLSTMQQPLDTQAEGLWRMLMTGDKSDAIIEVQRDSEALLEQRVHQNILSAHSTVFAAAFSNVKDPNEARIVCSNIAVPVIKWLLEYIYTGRLVGDNIIDITDDADDATQSLEDTSAAVPCIRPSSVDDWLDLLEAADRYAIDSMFPLCCAGIKHHLALQNVMKVIYCASRMPRGHHEHLQQLTDHAMHYLTRHSWTQQLQAFHAYEQQRTLAQLAVTPSKKRPRTDESQEPEPQALDSSQS